MKTLLLAAAAALTLSACATASGGQDNVSPAPAWIDRNATTFEGWVRMSGEEFRLYEEERDLRVPLSQACISGSLPRNLQRGSTDINGQRVRLTGRVAAWADREGGGPIWQWEGSRLSNSCRRDLVILATDITVLQ